mmetsp:Transcript_24441/g.44203  ORF Transcript_24441/g.44203 Transcript_24441/m.44203 type:complete len:292 (-) Transcript_24441:1003-1878(-)
MIVRTRKFRCGIDRHAHLVRETTAPQSTVGIKNLIRHQLKPFPCQSPRINALFAQKFKPPNHAQIRSTERHDRLHTIVQQVLSPHFNLHMTLGPFRPQITTYFLKPFRFLIKGLVLNGRNISIGHQVSSRHFRIGYSRVHHGFIGRHEGQGSSPHARIIALQKGEFAHICRAFGMKGSQIPIDASFVVLETDPLKLHVRDTNGSTPSPLFFIVVELNGLNLFLGILLLLWLNGQLEANLFASTGIGRTCDKDPLTGSNESKGLIGPDSWWDHHFKHLRLRWRFYYCGSRIV